MFRTRKSIHRVLRSDPCAGVLAPRICGNIETERFPHKATFWQRVAESAEAALANDPLPLYGYSKANGASNQSSPLTVLIRVEFDIKNQVSPRVAFACRDWLHSSSTRSLAPLQSTGSVNWSTPLHCARHPPCSIKTVVCHQCPFSSPHLHTFTNSASPPLVVSSVS